LFGRANFDWANEEVVVVVRRRVSTVKDPGIKRIVMNMAKTIRALDQPSYA
jgi:hypothetical protein